MNSERDARAALERYRLHGVRETGTELGRGSFATVVEVDYKGMRCAGKKIHPILSQPGEGDRLVCRFEEECRLLGALRHPHVVQFLGIFFDPETDLPVLVMEFLPVTLAQSLERYGLLPEEVNYALLRDVALGLRYLHEQRPPIIHRDLSANNVLLTGDMTAKISDLGVAKILRLTPAQMSRMTRAPGTNSYMPPEALRPNPRYDVTVDIFSFGVMMVHVLSGQWPLPSEATQVDPHNPTRVIGLSEAERRAEYLDAIGRGHPLMRLIGRCLSNSPNLRPSALDLVEHMREATDQHPLTFSNRVEMMQRIASSEREKEELQTQVGELERQVTGLRSGTEQQARGNQTKSIQVHPFSPHAKLIWRECSPMPVEIWWAQATVISGKVYVGGGVPVDCDGGWHVYNYDPVRNKWSILPPAPVDMCGLGQLNGKLVLVGGSLVDGDELTANIHVFDEESLRWVKSIPPMPSALMLAAVVSHGSALVVCGGFSPDRKPSTAVYVYNNESSQWHSAPPLPFRRTLCTGVVINECYIAAGCEVVLGDDITLDDLLNSTLACRSVVSAPLPILLDPNASSSQSSSVWKSLPDLPYYHPSMAAVGGCLLALGGHKKILSEYEATEDDFITAVHAYCPATSSWLQVGDLPTQHVFATTVPLPTGELLFTGGITWDEKKTDYIGTVN